MSGEFHSIMLHRCSNAPDALIEGYYRHEQRDHVPVPVRIWWGPALDPVSGETLDRAERWHIEIDGRSIDLPGQMPLGQFWPRCQRWPVDRAEYDYLVARARHDREHDQDSPFAQVSRRVDLLSATIPDIGG